MEAPMRVERFDRGELRSPTKTPAGFLRLDGYATRTGILLYRLPDGTTRRELRHPEDVARADSLSSLAGVPVTDEHPPELLTPETATRYQRGYTGDEVSLTGDKVATSLTVTDAALIKAIAEGRKVELSCGYTCDLDPTPGVWQGQEYDARQTNIVYNHLAVVPRGRAGPDVRLRLDAAAEASDDYPGHEPKEGTLTKIRIDGVDYEVSEAAATAITAKLRADSEAIEAAKATATEAEEKAETLSTQLEETTAKKDAAEDALKTAQTQRTDADAINAAVTKRLALIAQAQPYVGADVKLDALDDRGIREAALMAINPEAKFDGQSDEAIAIRFDAALEYVKPRVDSTGTLRAATAATTTTRSDAETAYQEMQTRNANAWKGEQKEAK
jgi:hypothetical protein